MSREMQSSRIAVSQSIIENVIYSDVRVNRRNFMFDTQFKTNNSQRERLIYIDIEEKLIFWMKNVFDKLLEMIKMIKKKNRNLIKNYNKQIDVIDEYLIDKRKYLEKNKALQEENVALQNEITDQKFVFRIMRQKLETLKTVNDRIRNVRKFISSSFRFATEHDINATDRFEKIKRFTVISNSTIFIEDRTKFEHWLFVMQSKLKTNDDWYSIERMTMTYVNTKFDEETYKHIATRLNKNSSRRYFTVNEVFDDLKRIYVDSNKMQTAMNAFIRLTQTDKYVEFHVFWNEFQRLMKEMNLSEHFLLIELKRKMFYRLQNVMFIEFNTIDDVYELIKQTQLKEDHYKRIDDVKSRRRSNADTTAESEIEIETKAISRTISINTISISINEKAVIFTIWNFNQFRTSISRITFRTLNFDSIKEKLMKTEKCFNCDELDHLSRDCFKSRKLRIAEMKVENENSKKE